MQIGGNIKSNIDLRASNVRSTANAEKSAIQSTVTDLRALKPVKAVYGLANKTAKNVIGQGGKFVDANATLVNSVLGRIR